MFRSRFFRLLSIMPLLAALCLVPDLLNAGAGAADAATCRVTTGGNSAHDGSTWALSMDLQTALQTVECSEVWVASGAYKPGSAVADSFVIHSGVKVLGGFSGNEDSRGQRDAAAHPTVLSGDVDNNDTIDGIGVTTTPDDIVGSNSAHVVIMDGNDVPVGPSTVLDGFIITAGDTQDDGGGLWCRASLSATAHCSPDLRRLTFQGNRASNGGGAYFDGTVGASSTPTLSDVAFIHNRATTRGGAMYNSGYSGGNSSPTIERATFAHNSAAVSGGAMFNGGYASGRSSPLITNATFVDNAAQYGGAMDGAGFSGGNSSPLLTNVTFHSNRADARGNTMDFTCSGGTCSPVIKNAIVWNDSNSFAGEFTGDITTITLERSIIQGGCPANGTCQGVVIADPMLGPLQDNGGFTLTMVPAAWSAAIDAVSCARAPFRDQRNAPRPDSLSAGLLARCDLGAVEVDAMAGDGIFADGFGLPPLRR